MSQLEAKDLPDQEADIDNMDDSESSDGEGDHSDDVSDEENDIRSEQGTTSNSGFREQADFHDGRMRRKAIFDNDNDLDDAEVFLLNLLVKAVLLYLVNFSFYFFSNFFTMFLRY